MRSLNNRCIHLFCSIDLQTHALSSFLITLPLSIYHVITCRMKLKKITHIHTLIQWINTHTGWEGPFFRGMLDTALKLLERPMLTVKRALRAGSSKQGNALRASVAWNCDAANHLQYTLLWLSKTVTFSTLHHIKRDVFLADDIKLHCYRPT